MNLLISAQELKAILKDENLIILDASEDNTMLGKVPEYKGVQIPNSRKFNTYTDFSDTKAQFPHTFPNQEQFEEECQKLGINQDSHIVVYDNLGVFNSPRVWWMFNAYGHKNIRVLDGGLPEWINHNYETEPIKRNEFLKGNFKATLDNSSIKYIDEVKANITSKECIVLDARAKGRFDGTSPEPRQGMRSGHIPNSFNLPQTEVTKDGKFKSKEELEEIFSKYNAFNKPMIFSCGSGVTACIILLASEIAYPGNKSIYDGSWTEWATLVQD